MGNDKFAKEKENRTEHDLIMVTLLDIKEDVGFMRGKIETMESNNSDWWSRMIAILACAIAWMKGA